MSRGEPHIIAHRGFSGGERHDIENSLAAFEQAAQLGVTWIETDVHATRDGVLIAFHDDVLDRVTDGCGQVAELDWATVRPAKIGGLQPIPTMREVFERLPDAAFNIDVKSAGAIVPLADLIETLDVHERVRVASFSDRRRRAVLRRLSRPVRSSPGQRVMTLTWLCARLPRLGAWYLRRFARDIDALQIPEHQGKLRVCDPKLIAAAHAAGKQVHVWTVNNAADMRRLLDLGVDAIITDRCDVALKVMDEQPLNSSQARLTEGDS